ncbi:MAG TPA: S8 family serine peptidase [Pyrinomonadaceae bacterium]
MKSGKHCRLRGWVSTSCVAVVLCVFVAALPCGVSRAARGSGDAPKLSPDLLALADGSHSGSVNVIIQQTDSSQKSLLEIVFNLVKLVTSVGGRVTGSFVKLGAVSARVPAQSLRTLSSRSEVRYVSPDRALVAGGHVETTTGTAAVRTQTSYALLGLLQTTTTFDGAGVGIAVVDSGLDAGHEVFRDSTGLSRVAASVDFTGEGRTDDPYGHGTHVASIAAGSGKPSNGAYGGVAPAAKIVNLRVLNSQGRGTTSALLAALEWVLQYRTLYKIRVVNLSLGTPTVDSYRNDPACDAVRRLVAAGVVVVAAAGNDGKGSTGQKLYGAIHSPGHEPAAVTVGASNSFGSNGRADDRLTSYSSRGPTRGYWTDDGGVRRYDNLLKPDLVAPGNKIIGAAAPNNALLAGHPELNADASQPASRRMMYMSGTSMSAPVAAGAAALMLQANPSLTPALVKSLLMVTAQPVFGYNTLEQGAGLLNVEGALRLAKLVRADLSAWTPLGAPLLTSGAPIPQSTVAGETFWWSQGVVLNHTFASGTDLYTFYQKVYAPGAQLGSGVNEGSGGAQSLNTSMMTGGVMLGRWLLTSDGSTMVGGTPVMEVSSLLDGTMAGDGVMAGDGIMAGDGTMAGDGIMAGDTSLQAQSILIEGDETPCMK